MAFNLGMNPYLDQNVNSALQNIGNNYRNTVQPQQAAQAAQSGSFGNSGVQQAQGYQNQQFGKTLADTAANMYGQAYNTDQANALTMRGQDQNYALGQGNLGLGFQNSNNSFALGQGNLALGNKQADQSYNLGQGNLNLGYQNSNNQYALGNKQADQNYALGNKQADNTYNLGLGTLQNNAIGQANQYDLGLRQNDLGFAGLDANIANSNAANQLNYANFGLNAFNAQQNAQNQAIAAGTQIQNTPYDYWNSFNTAANNVGNGLSSTTASQTATGNPWLGALGGWQLGSQIAKP